MGIPATFVAHLLELDAARKEKARRKPEDELKHGLYNINMGQLRQLYKLQNNCCAICGSTSTLCIDHDHSTGIVRGLLCKHCNTGLGHFKDNPQSLQNAIQYLQERSKGFGPP